MANECMFKLTVKSNNLDSIVRFADVLHKYDDGYRFYKTYYTGFNNVKCYDDIISVDFSGECSWTLYNLIITEDELKEHIENTLGVSFERFFNGKKYTNLQYWCKELGIEIEGTSFTLNWDVHGYIKVNNKGEVLDFYERYEDETDVSNLPPNRFLKKSAIVLDKFFSALDKNYVSVAVDVDNNPVDDNCSDENDE